MRAALLLALLLATPPLHATGPTVFWYRWPAEGLCSPSGGLRCGDHGIYQLSHTPVTFGGTCMPEASGSEVPRLYPLPSPAGGGDWAPCAGLSCFERSGRRPYVAVLDWPNEHGRVVGELVRHASDGLVDVELFDVEEEVAPLTLPGVGDVQVLARLCDVAQRVADGDPPLAVNLSFGRDPGGGKSAVCDQPGVPCEIRGVLQHLGTEGVVAVAGAGNHGGLLFPASLPEVLAAGSLHLSRLLELGEHHPSLETPAGANVLVAGHGLYLTNPSAPTEVYALAPGSSFAAATFTGWLTGAVHEASSSGGIPEISAGASWLSVADGGGGFVLAQDGEPFPASDLTGPSQLTARALAGEAHVCQGDAAPPDAPAVRLVPEPVALPQLPLDRALALAHGPLPGSQPCAECEGTPPPAGFEWPGGEPDLAVRLHRSAVGPGSPYAITGLYLRIEDTVWRLDRSSDTELLEALGDGAVPYLLLEGVDPFLPPGAQISLVYVVRLGEEHGGAEAWTSSPVHVHQH